MWMRNFHIAFVFLMLVALIGQPLMSALADPGEVNQEFHPLYVPIVIQGGRGIHGTVTFNGAPAENILLELRIGDGTNWDSAATTTSGSGGNYAFEGVPGLPEGQRYYVLYKNEGGISSHLWIWGTRQLTSYEEASAVHIGNFDISNIELISPPDGEVINLPHTFRWNPRPASPTDSYEFNLFDWEDDEVFFYTLPRLGYVESYTLDFFPHGFTTGVAYRWEMWVYSPDGGFGISLEDREVTFSE